MYSRSRCSPAVRASKEPKMTSRFSVLLIGLAAVLLAIPLASAQAPPPGSGPITYQGFIRIIDGQSLELRIDGKQIAVRVIGINAPQGNTPCGVEAKNAHKGLLQGGVHLEEDTTQYLDNRLRRLYYAYTLDGRSVAKELVGQGVAVPDGTGRELADLLAAQRDAQNQNRGCVAGIAKKLGTNGAQVKANINTAISADAASVPARPLAV